MAKSINRSLHVDLDTARSFIVRRLRRIVPIYLVVIISLLASFKFLLSHQHRASSEEILSAIGFYSNIHFYLKQKSYFTNVGFDL